MTSHAFDSFVLMNKQVGTSFHSFCFSLGATRHHDDGQFESASSQFTNHFCPAHLPHAVICYDQICADIQNVRQCFFSV